MIAIRKSQDRGYADHGWLKSFHTFSFADYHDPHFMGFGPLRVINEDRVAANQGFGTHPHRDMEIITYVLEGELAHKDSMGNGSVIKKGDVQRMSAGTGITHSEFNPSGTEAHFLQIWVIPNRKNLEPSYEQKHFHWSEKKGRPSLIASPDGHDGSLTVHADVKIYSLRMQPGQELNFEASPERELWLQVTFGDLDVESQLGSGQKYLLGAGDGAAAREEPGLLFRSEGPAEILIFDMAK